MATPPKRRRTVLDPIQQLKLQASMSNTANGQRAAQQLAELDSAPTAPAPAPAPTNVTISPVAEAANLSESPAPEQPSPQDELSTAPSLDEAPSPASPASLPTPSPARSTPANRATRTTPPVIDSSVGTTSIRLRPEVGSPIKDAINHYRVAHGQRITAQKFVDDAISHYFQHLRRTGKLPPV